MKNEKFCFNKGVGLFALVGVVLIALVLASQALMSTQTSTSTRAAGVSRRIVVPNQNLPKGNSTAIIATSCAEGKDLWYGTCVKTEDAFCPSESDFYGCDNKEGYIRYVTNLKVDKCTYYLKGLIPAPRNVCRPLAVFKNYMKLFPNNPNGQASPYCGQVTGKVSWCVMSYESKKEGLIKTDFTCPREHEMFGLGIPVVSSGICYTK